MVIRGAGLTPIGKSIQFTIERNGSSHDMVMEIAPSVEGARKDASKQE
jgi:hypothetical protein